MIFEYEVTIRFVVRAEKFKDVKTVGDPIFKQFANVPLENGIVSKECETRQTKGRRKK